MRAAIDATSGVARCSRSRADASGTSSRSGTRPIRSGVRPTTWVNYGDYIAAYVTPAHRETRLQDLTPVRLNLLYGHLLEHGRVKRARRPGAEDRPERAPHAAPRPPRRRQVGPDPPQRRRGRPAASGALEPEPTVWTPEQLRALRRPRPERPLLRALAARRHHRASSRRARRSAARGRRLRARTRHPRARRASWSTGRCAESETKTERRRIGHGPRSRRPSPLCATTSRPGARSGGCSAGARDCCSCGRTVDPCTRTRSPRCSTSTAPRRDSPGSGCTTCGTPTPPRLCKAGVPPKVDQRAARARDRRVHAADLHARHPGHGRGRRRQRGRPDPRRRRTPRRGRTHFRYAPSSRTTDKRELAWDKVPGQRW